MMMMWNRYLKKLSSMSWYRMALVCANHRALSIILMLRSVMAGFVDGPGHPDSVGSAAGGRSSQVIDGPARAMSQSPDA